jgi:long-chain fatty acid transport protein
MKRRIALHALLLCAFPSLVWAGGFELPDNGTEALGRGGAFAAKADNATALVYNVAGFARQRGTRVLLDNNIFLPDYTFARSGSYPGDPNDPATPYAGQPFPKVSNGAGPFYAPFFGVSTDFGKLDRWTFAIGAYGPPSVGNRDWGTTVQQNGKTLPAPGRYDLVSSNLLIVYPTLAAAVRATHWLDLGVAVHLAVASFTLQTASVADLGSVLCPNAEYQPCDAPTHIETSAVTATASFGAMIHPIDSIAIGVNLRGPVDVNSTGTVSTPGPMAQKDAQSGEGTFTSHLPWQLRLGLRYIFLHDRFEAGDIEVDGVYEPWAAAEGDGDRLDIDHLGFLSGIHAKIIHNYRDTVSARVGGAYNIKLPEGVLTLRLGGYFDSAATKYKDTRLDFDTMVKWAGTAGIGYRVRGVGLNVAYAYIWSPDRTVANGDLQAINGFDGSTSTGNGPLPVVNRGTYHANTQIVSVGITVAWDELLKKSRVLAYE